MRPVHEPKLNSFVVKITNDVRRLTTPSLIFSPPNCMDAPRAGAVAAATHFSFTFQA